jgi:hypothetical protein
MRRGYLNEKLQKAGNNLGGRYLQLIKANDARSGPLAHLELTYIDGDRVAALPLYVEDNRYFTSSP